MDLKWGMLEVYVGRRLLLTRERNTQVKKRQEGIF